MLKKVVLKINTVITLMLVSVLFLLSCSTNKPVKIKVASYNVEYGRRSTPEAIGNMLKAYDLDIIGFCEIPDSNWTERIGKVLDMKYSYVGEISSANHDDKYKSILSKTPLSNTNEFVLDGSNGWNPASTVRAETTINGKHIAFYSLHICASHYNDGHAYKLATEVLANDKVDNIIVVGDFNNRAVDTALTEIYKLGFKPIWEYLSYNVSDSSLTTYNAYLDPNIDYYIGVIDHIFFKSSLGKVTDGEIIELNEPLSDHKPIWAEIEF